MNFYQYAFIGVISLSLMGCFKMETISEITPEGKLSLEVNYDFSGVSDYQQQESAGLTTQWDGFCTQYYAEVQRFEAANQILEPNYTVECTDLGDYKAQINLSTQLTAGDDYETTEDSFNTTFRNLITFESAEGVNMSEAFGNDFSEIQSVEQIDQLKEAGIDFNFVLNLPGDITQNDIGTIGPAPHQLSIGMKDLDKLISGSPLNITSTLQRSQPVPEESLLEADFFHSAGRKLNNAIIFSTFEKDQPRIINPEVPMNSTVSNAHLLDYDNMSFKQKRTASSFNFDHPIMDFKKGPSNSYRYHQYQQAVQKAIQEEKFYSSPYQ